MLMCAVSRMGSSYIIARSYLEGRLRECAYCDCTTFGSGTYASLTDSTIFSQDPRKQHKHVMVSCDCVTLCSPESCSQNPPPPLPLLRRLVHYSQKTQGPVC